MCAGIADAVAAIGVRQVVAGFPRIKGELKHLHAGESAAFEQKPHFVGQEAEILRDDLEAGERLLQPIHKVCARAENPFTVARGRRIRGNTPIGGKPAEVVDAHTVKQGAGGAHAAHPPRVTGLLHIVPIIDRVAPKLTVRGEIVRRNTRDAARMALVVELELLRCAPDIGGIKRNIDRQIADDLDLPLVCVGAELRPLLVEEALQVLIESHVLAEAFPRGGKRPFLAHAQFIRPVFPGDAAVFVLERHEQRIIVQPVRVFGSKAVERLHVIPAILRARKCRAEYGKALFENRAVIDLPLAIAPADGCNPIAIQKPFVREHVKIDEIRVACKRGERLVRRVAIAGRPERKYLPVVLACAHELIDKNIRGFPERADAIRGGQR